MDELLRELAEQDIWEGLADKFRVFDEDKSGELEEHELAEAIRSLGIELSDDDAHMIFKRMDMDGSGTVALDEFLLELECCWSEDGDVPDGTPQELFRMAITMMLDEMQTEVDKFAPVQEVFEEMDRDNSGQLDYREFVDAMTTLRVTLSDDDIFKVFKKIDVTGDGQLEIMEFFLAVGGVAARLRKEKGAGGTDKPEDLLDLALMRILHPNKTDAQHREHLKRKGPEIPDVSPGDPIQCPGGDDGLPLTFVCEDKVSRISLSKSESLLSSVAYDKLKDGNVGMGDIWFENVNSRQLQYVVEYLKRHKGRRPPMLEKPITRPDLDTRSMMAVVTKGNGDPWDAVFCDKFLKTKAKVYDFIQGCYYMGVRDGLYLGCCKIACMAPPEMSPPVRPEVINDWISYDDEQEQGEQGLAAAWGL